MLRLAVSLGLVVGVVAACTDDLAYPTAPALGKATELAIVAHEDDDLLFMQPDLFDDVRATEPVTIVYVTAGNATHGVDYTESRQFGVMRGYGSLDDESLPDWKCGWIDVVDHPAQACRLANLTLVFLGYPDGGEEGQLPESLLKLWQGNVATGRTMSRRPSEYSQAELVDGIASIVTATAPTTVHILDVASNHGHDHVDHEIVGALALLGITRSGTAPRIVAHRGYDVANEGIDKPAPLLDQQLTALEAYDSCISLDDTGCVTPSDTTDPQHVIWAARRYGIGFRSSLRGVTIEAGSGDGSGCVALDPDMMATLVDCTTAPAWTLAPSGEFATAGSGGSGSSACLEVLPTGELAGTSCDPATDAPVDETRRLFVDDEGHVWGGLVPVPQANMQEQHLDCMAASGGRPRLVLCGAGNAPTWTFAPASGLAAAIVVPVGVRPALADFDGDGLADLGYDDGAEVFFAHGNGDGTFAGAQLLGALRIVPGSFVAADVDGDGKADACGHATGSDDAVCALSTTGYASMTAWGPALAPIAVGGAGDASFAALGGELCAVTGTRSIDCAPRNAAAAERLSNQPSPGTPIWFGILAGFQADWCSAAPSGAACGLRNEASITEDAVPWSYSLHGEVDAPPLGLGVTALADVDGDGFADLCGLGSDGVRCARGQGHGFGPTIGLAALPGGTQLVLGDLDGDGHADPCVVGGDGTVTCQLAP